MPRKTKTSPELRAEINRLKTDERMSAREIAERLNASVYSVGAIFGALARAEIARVGRPPERVRTPTPARVKHAKPKPAAKTRRKCLSHQGPFMSEGAHEQICPACKLSQRHSSGIAGDYSLAGVR